MHDADGDCGDYPARVLGDLLPSAADWLSEVTSIPLRALRLRRLRGSTSSTLYRVENAAAPAGRRFVLRLFTLADWLAVEPDLARHEAAALTLAAQVGVATPELVAYLDGPSSEHPGDPGGFGAPVVVMTHLPGRVELTPVTEGAWLDAAARTLAKIHSVEAADFPWTYSSWVEPMNVAVPVWATDVSLWERAVEAYRRWRPHREEWRFLHRDFHMGNLLFTGERDATRVAGVVDWVNACRGPTAADVSHCRVDLLLLRGTGAADRFLTAYRGERGSFEYDPTWDLEAVFDVALPSPNFYPPWSEFGVPRWTDEEGRRRVEEFVREAVEELGDA